MRTSRLVGPRVPISWVERFEAKKNKWIMVDEGRPGTAETSDGGVSLGTARYGQVWDPEPGDEDHATPTIAPGPAVKLNEEVKEQGAPTPGPPTTSSPTDGP